MGTLIRIFTIAAVCVLNTLPLSAMADTGRELQQVNLQAVAASSDACQVERTANAVSLVCSQAAFMPASWMAVSPINPVWQIDLQAASLRDEPARPKQSGGMSYVADVYRITRDFGRRLLLEPARLLKPSPRPAAGSLPIGIELDDGWSVGLGYNSGTNELPGPSYSTVPQGGRSEPSAMLLTHRRF